MNSASLLALLLALPFATAAGIAAVHRHARLFRIVVLAGAWLAPVVLAMLIAINAARAEFTLFSLWGGLETGFALEPLGLVFAGVVCVLWPVSMAYSLSYLDVNRMRHKARFCALFSVSVGGALGVAFARDLLTMLIFYELLTFITYPLVTHEKNPRTRAAGRVYLSFLLGTSLLFLLPAIVWTWAACGDLRFAPGGMVGECVAQPEWLFVLFVLGAGKAALFPLHRWLPAAMVAPAPVSALLHAVAVVKAGVFVILKVAAQVFGFDLLEAIAADWLVYLAGTSAAVAALIALRQDSLKKRLAYSTISQLGYITLGVALLKPAVAGAVVHIAAHAFGKITLFFAAGAIQSMSGKSRVSELGGIGRAMPWTMACFAVAAASMIGLPPLAGFASKWLIISGAAQTGQLFAVGILLLVTVLNAAYFGPIVWRAWAAPAPPGAREAPSGMVMPMLLTAAGVVALFWVAGGLVRAG